MPPTKPQKTVKKTSGIKEAAMIFCQFCRIDLVTFSLATSGVLAGLVASSRSPTSVAFIAEKVVPLITQPSRRLEPASACARAS